MPHLVPIPLPKDYHVPQTINKTYVYRGETLIGVWGHPQTTNPGTYRVGTVGWDLNDDVNSRLEGPHRNHSDIMVYRVGAARKGYKLALFERFRNTEQEEELNWRPQTGFIEVSWDTGDKYADLLKKGHLPKCKYNEKIGYYPFGSSCRNIPVSEDDWLKSIDLAFDKICSHPLGVKLVRLVGDVVIHPWIQSYVNATSSVKFSPQDFKDTDDFGGAPHEVLLHELIHVIERNYRGYEDRYGFKYDDADFLTVNAVNVYSRLHGRGLRKDHTFFTKMPDEHTNNPKVHYEQQRPNYEKARKSAPEVVNALLEYDQVWNPFVYMTKEEPNIPRSVRNTQDYHQDSHRLDTPGYPKGRDTQRHRTKIVTPKKRDYGF